MLITPRLTLSEFTLLDDAFIVTILNSPGWAEFIGPTKVKSLELAQNYIQKTLQNSYKENGYGLWKVTLTASNTPIGMCGLVKRSYLPDPDLGFAFCQNTWVRAMRWRSAGLACNSQKVNWASPEFRPLPMRKTHGLSSCWKNWSSNLKRP